MRPTLTIAAALLATLALALNSCGPGGGNPSPTELKLTNQSGEMLWYEARQQCAHQSWSQLRQNGVPFSPEYNACRFQSKCSQVGFGSCSAVLCAACQAGVSDPKTIGQGETLSRDWEGWKWVESTRRDCDCGKRTTPQKGETLQARFCWYTSKPENDGGGGNVTPEPTCETVEFTYGEDATVTHTIK